MNPATDVAQALTLLERALKGLEDAGIPNDAVLSLDDAVERLKAAQDDLPTLIHQQCAAGGCTYCDDCRFYDIPQTRHLYASGVTIRDYYECTNDDNQLKCPAVRAAGFIDESDPAQVVPGYLRRQAE